MKHTEDQRKLALVRALPEKLTETDYYGRRQVWAHGEFIWKDTRVAVTPHEWLAIVGMVEAGLNNVQWWNYQEKLTELCGAGVRLCVTAPWQVRTKALADIGAITIV